MEKLPVGIIGATGMVGQRLATRLAKHPWLEITTVAASERSAGKTYAEAVAGRWKIPGEEIPPAVANLVVKNASDVRAIAGEVNFVFCALDMPKREILALEEAFAQNEVPVISCNSANRDTPDVPMVIPEINPSHLGLIPYQRQRLGANYGFIAVKPNCSLQSFLPPLFPLRVFYPKRVMVSTYQAISGAGKTFADWPKMEDNVIPFINGEEEKSEQEPLKILGRAAEGRIICADRPIISAQCVRVPVTDGHLATVWVLFRIKPTIEQILEKWRNFSGEPQKLNLPSAPNPFLTYFSEPDRPQTKLDRDLGNGMGIAIGRLRPDTIFHYKFVCLSHNTIRGAGGGAILLAELMVAKKYLAAR